MKTPKISIVCVLAVLFFSCNGQNLKNQNKASNNTEKSGISKRTPADTLNKPLVKINANKRYDDKGRLIQFDSTYSYFYSNPTGTRHLNNDSIFENFQSFFNKSYPSIFKDQNQDIFFNDSLFKYDFFNDDYFLRRYQLNQKNFEGFYKRMDSLKGDFLKHAYPNVYQKKK